MRAVWVLALAVVLGGPVVGQTLPGGPGGASDGLAETAPQVPSSALLTVDVERLFTQSLFGQRIAQDYASGREGLAAENRRIADALREEELALAEQRPEMDLAVFRAEAAAFDEKAQAIRRAQDAKERQLETTLTDGRDRFLVVTQPILGQILIERGAYAILDRRSVLLSLGSVDVTEDAIALIDAGIGDGSP